MIVDNFRDLNDLERRRLQLQIQRHHDRRRNQRIPVPLRNQHQVMGSNNLTEPRSNNPAAGPGKWYYLGFFMVTLTSLTTAFLAINIEQIVSTLEAGSSVSRNNAVQIRGFNTPASNEDLRYLAQEILETEAWINILKKNLKEKKDLMKKLEEDKERMAQRNGNGKDAIPKDAKNRNSNTDESIQATQMDHSKDSSESQKFRN